jgi:ubiquinone/menaquinone biosynthesis C-methylase UbiE
MKHDRKKSYAYWNSYDVESMYDKYLLNAEIKLIKQRIPPDTKVLDIGCGEGEGALVYSGIPGILLHAVDFSETRLKMAAEKLKGRRNVVLRRVDVLEQCCLDDDYDIIVSQRFLINLTEWELQKKVLLDLMSRLKSGGRLLMLEGSKQGAESLNEFRMAWGLDPIPIKWHNLFFDNDALLEVMQEYGYDLLEEGGLGAYFVLTRGVRPYFDSELNWDCEFNRVAATENMSKLLAVGSRFSRLKLWVFQK